LSDDAPRCRRPKNLTGRELPADWEQAGDPYPLKFLETPIHKRNGLVVNSPAACLDCHVAVWMQWWPDAGSATFPNPLPRLVHHCYDTGPGINYAIANAEDTIIFNWPAWLDDQAYNWIENITWTYTWTAEAFHAPVKPRVTLWDRDYDIYDGTRTLDMYFPVEKGDPLITFGVNRDDWPVFCPPGTLRDDTLVAPMELTMWWNPWFRKNCFEAEITEFGPLYFWISRQEENPPILCPPFYLFTPEEDRP